MVAAPHPVQRIDLSGRLGQRADGVLRPAARLRQPGVRQGHMITSTGYIPGYDIPGFSTYGAAAGLSGRAWGVQVYAQNLTNVDASATTDSGQFVLVKVPIRPRVFGLSMTYSFQEK